MKEYEIITQSMNANETELERATISMPSSLLEQGKTKAKEERRSFSAYVAMLVEQDLASDGEGESQNSKSNDAA